MKSLWNIKNNKINQENLASIEKIFSKNISKDDIIAVGVSGGVDSMFLSCALYNFFISHKYNIKNLIFIHLNHGVRTESIQEAKTLKQRFKLTNFVYITRSKSSKNTENELRKWRYQSFLDVMNKRGATKIFLGHHFDDRVETSILNLIRGCGIDGFMGIKPIELHHLLDGKTVIRPLISFNKSKIISISKKYKIPFVEDKTNKDIKVSQRNYLRNELLPNLFSQTGFEKLFKTRYKRYDKQTNEKLLQPITISPYRNAKSAYCLSKKREEINTQDIIRILKSLHASAGVTRETLKVFLDFIQNSNKGRKHIQGVVVIVAHGKIYFFVAKPLFREKTIDNDKQIDNLNIIKRYPQKNDIFRGKTRNKYCITEKIPIFRRNFIPVFAQGNKVISREKKDRETKTIF